MKCRGCGRDIPAAGTHVDGVGFMHWRCEVKRLRGRVSELESEVEQLKNAIADELGEDLLRDI